MKIKYDGVMSLTDFDMHDQIKQPMLHLLDEAYTQSIFVDDDKITEKIARYDWENRRNFDREWVLAFLPHLQRNLFKAILELGYEDFDIDDMWFQQYQGESSHGWHIHGSQFSGIYYIEYPDEAKQTELLNPYTQTDLISLPTIREGQLFLAPSYIIHRCPPHFLNSRRTVIVFNFIVKEVSGEILKS